VSVVVQDGERLFQTTLIDISERRAAEAALQQRDEQLRQAQKLESIGQLAGGVAHDLNNLLSVVIGRGQLLLQRLPPGARDAKGVEMIVSSAERGAAVVRQLLTFSRRQPVELRALDLNRVLVDLAPMLRRFIGEQIELVVRQGPDLGWVRADKSQLEQIAMNLVINARDAMPDGGTVVVETANVDLSEDYARQHVDSAPGPYVMLAVTDTGTGMDAATQARIFEPFFTTKELGKGTGLGLATVYGIVNQSHGSIWVYSEVGRGTTFKIHLPRVLPHADDGRAAAPRPRQGSETILVAEDEAEVRELVQDILQSYGYTVLVARDAAEALLIAERHTGPIHLLLTDVIMPGATGRDLATRLGPLRPETRTLYMSGYPGEAIVRQGRLEPGTEYLQKPCLPEALAAKVRPVLDAAD
jgi:two-component system, cell cycle sensor histidine kinase and response regulator CckA